MKTLSITRWSIGGEDTKLHAFDDECVIELHGSEAGPNIAVLNAPSEEGGIASAYFCGVSEARWLDD